MPSSIKGRPRLKASNTPLQCLLTVLILYCGIIHSALATTQGAPTQGADGCTSRQVYEITKLTDGDEPGTLRHALHVAHWGEKARTAKSCREIRFAVGGEIELQAPIRVRSSFVTVDGCTAPAPGITITQANNGRRGNPIMIDGTRGYTHDLVFKCLRFQDRHSEAPTHKVGSSLFVIDADCTPINCHGDWKKKDGGVANVGLEKIIFAESRDKLTIWGKVKNLLITQSFFYHNPLALLLSYYAGPYDLQRKNLLLTGNLFIANNERNPQIRGWTDSLHIRNNVIASWDAFPPLPAELSAVGDGYGIRLKSELNEKPINANIVNNVFMPGDHQISKARALIYGWVPGPDPQDGGPVACLAQGEQYPDSNMGELWVSGNQLPAENCDHYSTVNTPLARPAWDNAEILESDEVCAHTLRQVEPMFPTEIERVLLAQARASCSVKET